MPEVNIERLTKRAIAIYAQERSALINGDVHGMSDAAEKKAALLADLKSIESMLYATPASPASEQSRGQMASLHAIIARRMSENGQLAKANSAHARSAWQAGCA